MERIVLAEKKAFDSSLGEWLKYRERHRSPAYYNFSNENWAPSVNLYETDEAYIACVDLAGVEKEKIDIEVVDGRLTLRGNRAVPTCCQAADLDLQKVRVRMHLMEIDHGPFARDVLLPQDVQRDRIEAKYHDGLLWIELPKKN